MNKSKVDQYIVYAYEAIKKQEISDKSNVVDSGFRSQISSFGASITMGSLLSAIAFFEDENKAEVDRKKLTRAILNILEESNECGHYDELSDYAIQMKKAKKEYEAKENIVNASIALKLAMNLYTLKKKASDSNKEA